MGENEVNSIVINDEVKLDHRRGDINIELHSRQEVDVNVDLQNGEPIVTEI